MPAMKSASLGWGQRYMWLRHHQQPEDARHETNLMVTCDLEHAIPVAKLHALVNHVVRRHEALRTTYHHDTDGDPCQRVHPPASLPMAVVTTERDGTPGPADIVGPMGSAAFDLAAEWPIRACAITTGGVPKRLVLVFNHMSVDRWTTMRIDHDLGVLYTAIREGRPARLEPIRHQPLDLARHESSRTAAAAAARCTDWWRAELALLPADPMAARRGPAVAPSAHEATLTSPALLTAGRRIALRHGVWPSLVHFTAYTAMMAAYTGSDTVVMLSFTSNRESNPLGDVHTCLFSPLLMRVDCGGDPSFGTLVRRVAASFERSQRHSYVPYDATVDLAALESSRRGQVVRLGAELNLLGEQGQDSRVRHTTLLRKRTPEAWASVGSDTYVRIHEWRDAVSVTLSAASTVMDADAVERFLRGYEHAVLAHDESRDQRISEIAAAAAFAPPARRPLIVHGDPVDLDRTAEVLGAHPAVRAARLSIVDDELVADVTAEFPVTAAELRAHVLGGLDDPGAVRCPSRFRIRCGETESDDRGVASPVAAADAAERALAAAVCRANGIDAISMADSYPVAGGRALRIPRVLDLLAAQGLTSIRVRDLASALPLRALAARLTRTEGGPPGPQCRPADPGSRTAKPTLAGI